MVEVLKPSYDGEQAIKGGRGGGAVSMGEADPSSHHRFTITFLTPLKVH